MDELGAERPRAKFGHGAVYNLDPVVPLLVGCYHPSPRNTNTGRLNMEQMVETLKMAKGLAGEANEQSKTGRA